MRRSTVRVIAIVCVFAYVLLVSASLLLDRQSAAPDAFATVVVGVFAAYLVAGVVIAVRTGGNPVGWCLVTMALAVAVVSAADEYARYGILGRSGPLPGAEFAFWLSIWVWIGMMVPLVFAIFLFPTGTLPSPRWRPIAWAIGLFMSGVAGAFAFGQPGQPDQPELRNPFQVEALRPVYDWVKAGYPLFIIIFGTAVASLVVRARRASPEQRQQLKWIAAAAVFMLTMFSLEAVLAPLSDFLWPLTVSVLPVAIAIAMLRYRLYDIDRIVNRALVYGALSGTLGAIYVAFVVVSQGVLRPLTGGSEIAVAISTLATLALVQPLRRRVSDIVDLRFYRSRYDAARTLDGFARRLRNEVDIEAVQGDVLDVVRETFQPAHASVWLREARTGSGGK